MEVKAIKSQGRLVMANQIHPKQMSFSDQAYSSYEERANIKCSFKKCCGDQTSTTS
ncbi:hypothetical protein KSC_026110 [Ktedonobacter sp. SOSP1-52]|nr:hypothetical protein KSC_026110 [Ktedonobacter sp. SOSP1-52]